MGEPEMTAEQLLAEYEGGRRDFTYLVLDGLSLAGADLRGVKLEGSSLVGADLSKANLWDAQLVRTNLTRACLRAASLRDVQAVGGIFVGADLRGVDLDESHLWLAKLNNADMSGAFLEGAALEDTDLTGAYLDGAYLGGTHFFDVDVRPLCDAQRLTLFSPSAIDARTTMKSYKHPRLKAFMIECGVPEIFAEYMIECARALGDDALRELMQSTFISYGGPDESFGRRLYDALRAHGVVTFFFPESARIGERIGDEVFSALQRHDRMILVCSRESLDRKGVLNEVQETLDREARDGGAAYLIPVMLDDYLLTEWKEAQPELAERVTFRVAADFRGADSDPAKFDAALRRLLDALKKKSPGTYASPV